ncbi:MAG: hypothetical protein Q4D81_11245 [Eubacteriales bacterium]|nr:hypothetical protein [Eubacteriales bacterium]
MTEMEKLNLNDLEEATGGIGGGGVISWGKAISNVASGYLALRNAPGTEDGNVITRIENGVSFLINEGRTLGNYIWARYNNQEGWVSRELITRLRGDKEV